MSMFYSLYTKYSTHIGCGAHVSLRSAPVIYVAA